VITSLLLKEVAIPNQVSLEQIELAELAQSVDDARAAEDPFKLPADLRTLLDTRLADLKTKDAATQLTEGGRATASATLRAALDQLRTLLRDGYNFIQGLGSFAIDDATRLGVFTSYGWESGLVGDFTDARIESLANQAITATPSIADPAHRYPDALLALITTQLGIVNGNQTLATGGTAQAATDARDAALTLLQLATARVRFQYCVVSDDTDQSPELVTIGRQPRRDAGAATGQPLPGEVTFDDTALTLTAPALPDHATTLRAYPQAVGGLEQRPTNDGASMTKVLNETGGRGCQAWIKMDQTSEVFKTSEV
jgi:hypothetical protein